MERSGNYGSRLTIMHNRVRIGIVGIKWVSFLFAYPATGPKMDACGGICNRIGRIWLRPIAPDCARLRSAAADCARLRGRKVKPQRKAGRLREEREARCKPEAKLFSNGDVADWKLRGKSVLQGRYNEFSVFDLPDRHSLGPSKSSKKVLLFATV